jgi:hypothetical protein
MIKSIATRLRRVTRELYTKGEVCPTCGVPKDLPTTILVGCIDDPPDVEYDVTDGKPLPPECPTCGKYPHLVFLQSVDRKKSDPSTGLP